MIDQIYKALFPVLKDASQSLHKLNHKKKKRMFRLQRIELWLRFRKRFSSKTSATDEQYMTSLYPITCHSITKTDPDESTSSQFHETQGAHRRALIIPGWMF